MNRLIERSARKPFANNVEDLLPDNIEGYLLLDKIMMLEGFEAFSHKMVAIHEHTQILKDRGLELRTLANTMGLVFTGLNDIDVTRAANLYHRYLIAEGYLDPSSKFVVYDGAMRTREPSDDCLHAAGEECADLVSGTICISNCEILDWTEKRTFVVQSKFKREVAVVLGVSSNKMPDRLADVVSYIPLTKIHLAAINSNLAMRAKRLFLIAMNQRYSGKMKFEGGVDGKSIRICAQNIVSRCEGDEAALSDAVRSVLDEIHERQFSRFKQNEDNIASVDPLLLTSQEILGRNPQYKSAEWTELQNMVGLKRVKASIQSLLFGQLVNQARGTYEQAVLEIGRSGLFIGPPGTGKTTVAKLYGKILTHFGVLSQGDLVVKTADDFIDKYIGGSTEKTRRIMEEAKGCVLLIDEAYGLNPTNARQETLDGSKKEVIDTLVGRFQNSLNEDIFVIMCGYNDEMEAFISGSANPGLQRRFCLSDAFVFEEFTEEELGKILDLKIKDRQLRMSINGRKVALDALRLAKQRPNFGNGGEVENLISRAIRNLYTRTGTQLQGLPAGSESILDLAELDLLCEEDFDPGYSKRLQMEDEVDYQFRDFIGCEPQIQIFRSMARRVAVMTKRGVHPISVIPFSIILKGPPGTGKTTFARRLGALYHKMGILSTSEVVESSASDVIGTYVGHTVNKTVGLMKRALGKVLFIDEAYRLSGEHNYNGFAKEALEELVDGMTKPRFHGKIVIILAGYTSEMEDFLKANPGLASRFRDHIELPPMSSSACLQLLQKNVEQGGVRISGWDKKKFEAIFDRLSLLPSWGNGRDVETIAKEIVGQSYEDIYGDPYGDLKVTEDTAMKVLHDWCKRFNVFPDPEPSEFDCDPMATENDLQHVPSAPQIDSGMFIGDSRVWTEPNTPTGSDDGSTCNETNESVLTRNAVLYKIPLNRARKEIRLLTIRPGDETISCELEIVSLLEYPKYYVLSYVWGNPVVTTNITVAGVTVAITTNLWHALSRIRSFEGGRYAQNIWIDAICINQSDAADKAYQIPLMRDIYSNPQRAIAWLGPQEGTDKFLQLRRRLLDLDIANSDSVPEILHTFHLELTLEENPFWQRAWIVQELCLPADPPLLLSANMCMDLKAYFASNMKLGSVRDSFHTTMRDYCQNLTITKSQSLWKTIKASERLRSSDIEKSSFVHTVALENLRANFDRFRNNAFNTEFNSDILLASLIMIVGKRRASNPSDLVYGLLGMMSEEHRKSITIDYQTPYMKVFQNFFGILWTSYVRGELYVLLRSTALSCQDGTYPSWVPDMTRIDRTWFISPERKLVPTHRRFKLSDDGSCLLAFGKLAGLISSSERGLDPVRDGITSADAKVNWEFQFPRDEIKLTLFIKRLAAIQRRLALIDQAEIAELDGQRHSSIEMLAKMPPMQLWESMIRGQDENANNSFKEFWVKVVQSRDIGKSVRTFIKELLHEQAAAPLMYHNEQLLVVYLRNLAEVLCRDFPQLIVTSRGLVALCTSGVGPGDLLVLLDGFHQPVVMRGHPGGYHTIVGIANFLRVTDIEISSVLSRMGIEDKDFRIR